MSRSTLRLFASLILVIIFSAVIVLTVASTFEPSSVMPRFVHRHYAHVNGYPWVKCPVTGQMFGGHESYQGKGVLDPKNADRLKRPAESDQRALILLQVAKYNTVSQPAGELLKQLRAEGVVETDLLEAARKRWAEQNND